MKRGRVPAAATFELLLTLAWGVAACITRLTPRRHMTRGMRVIQVQAVTIAMSMMASAATPKLAIPWRRSFP